MAGESGMSYSQHIFIFNSSAQSAESAGAAAGAVQLGVSFLCHGVNKRIRSWHKAEARAAARWGWGWYWGCKGRTREKRLCWPVYGWQWQQYPRSLGICIGSCWTELIEPRYIELNAFQCVAKHRSSPSRAAEQQQQHHTLSFMQRVASCIFLAPAEVWEF